MSSYLCTALYVGCALHINTAIFYQAWTNLFLLLSWEGVECWVLACLWSSIELCLWFYYDLTFTCFIALGFLHVPPFHSWFILVWARVGSRPSVFRCDVWIESDTYIDHAKCHNAPGFLFPLNLLKSNKGTQNTPSTKHLAKWQAVKAASPRNPRPSKF